MATAEKCRTSRRPSQSFPNEARRHYAGRNHAWDAQNRSGRMIWRNSPASSAATVCGARGCRRSSPSVARPRATTRPDNQLEL